MQLKSCPVCGVSEFISLKQYAHAHLAQCTSCNFVFSDQFFRLNHMLYCFNQYDHIKLFIFEMTCFQCPMMHA